MRWIPVFSAALASISNSTQHINNIPPIIPGLLVCPSPEKQQPQARAVLYLILNPQHLSIMEDKHDRYSIHAFSRDHFSLAHCVSIASVHVDTNSRTHFARWFNETNVLSSLGHQWFSHKDLCFTWCRTKSSWSGQILSQIKSTLKMDRFGLPLWPSGWEFACQCRGHRFDPWSGKIPHAAGQLACTQTTDAHTP